MSNYTRLYKPQKDYSRLYKPQKNYSRLYKPQKVKGNQGYLLSPQVNNRVLHRVPTEHRSLGFRFSGTRHVNQGPQNYCNLVFRTYNTVVIQETIRGILSLTIPTPARIPKRIKVTYPTTNTATTEAPYEGGGGLELQGDFSI